MSEIRAARSDTPRWRPRLLPAGPRQQNASGRSTADAPDNPGQGNGRSGWGYHVGAATIAEKPVNEESRSDTVDLRATDVNSTLDLLALAKAGERSALELLFQRCLPPLRRWARGRLPDYARGMAETQDLVQEVVLRTLHNLAGFDARHQGALQAYLRQAVANRIRDEVRRATRHPAPFHLSEVHPDASASPLERAIGTEGLERYERALARLREPDRQVIVARIELQQSYQEIAVVMGKPSANAARVAVTRALTRLTEELGRGR